MDDSSIINDDCMENPCRWMIFRCPRVPMGPLLPSQGSRRRFPRAGLHRCRRPNPWSPRSPGPWSRWGLQRAKSWQPHGIIVKNHGEIWENLGKSWENHGKIEKKCGCRSSVPYLTVGNQKLRIHQLETAWFQAIFTGTFGQPPNIWKLKEELQYILMLDANQESSLRLLGEPPKVQSHFETNETNAATWDG